MKVLYDFQKFQAPGIRGIKRYFINLNKFSHYAPDIDTQIYCPYKYHQTYTHNPLHKISNLTNRKRIHKRNVISTRRHIQKENINLIHPTYYDPYVLELKIPYVLTVFDLVHELFPKKFPFYDDTSQKKKMVIQNAKVIISISRNTKKDLVNYYKIKPELIKTIHLASSISLKNKIETNVPDNYFTFVGARNSYKNFDNLIKAISPILMQSKINLLCVGGGKFTKQEKKLLDRHQVIRLVSQRSATDNQLAFIYSKSLAVIYPSLYEGFGLPIVEAMGCDCPVITSNTSSPPEVAGNAGIYFDPYSIQSMRSTVQDYIGNLKNNQISQIKKGRKRIKKFTWRKTSEKTYEVYRSLIK